MKDHEDVDLPLVLVVDLPGELDRLIAAWLSRAHLLVEHIAAHEAIAPALLRAASAAVVNLPHLRRSFDLHRLQALSGTPVVALSATLMSGVAAHGALAQELGVAALLPISVSGDQLVAAVTAAAALRT